MKPLDDFFRQDIHHKMNHEYPVRKFVRIFLFGSVLIVAGIAVIWARKREFPTDAISNGTIVELPLESSRTGRRYRLRVEFQDEHQDKHWCQSTWTVPLMHIRHSVGDRIEVNYNREYPDMNSIRNPDESHPEWVLIVLGSITLAYSFASRTQSASKGIRASNENATSEKVNT